MYWIIWIFVFQLDQEKPDPIKGFGSLSDSEATKKNITYSWSGITARTRQQRRSIKDTILQSEPKGTKTILRDGKQ